MNKKARHRIRKYLFFTLLLISAGLKGLAYNTYYYVGMENQVGYRCMITITFSDGSSTSWTIKKTTSNDTCYNFLKTDYAVYNSYTTNKPNVSISSIALSEERYDSNNEEYYWVKLISKIYKSTQYTYILAPPSTNGRGNVVVYVDAPVSIINVTKYMYLNVQLTELCVDDLFNGIINSTAFFNVHGFNRSFKIYSKDGAWVNFPYSFSTNDINNTKPALNQQVRLKVITERLIPGSSSYSEQIENEYLGPIIWESFSDCQVKAPPVCTNEKPVLEFYLPKNDGYIFTINMFGDSGSGCNVNSSTISGDYDTGKGCYILESGTTPVMSENNNSTLNLDPGTTYDISVEHAGCSDVNETLPKATPCAYNTQVTIPDLYPLPIFITQPTPVNCYGSSTGNITVSLTADSYNRSLTYTTYIDNSTNNVNHINYGAWYKGNLPAKNGYVVKMVDNRGCYYTNTVDIEAPSQALSATASVSNQVSCHINNDGTHNDGEIQISASGGWGGYTYSSTLSGTYGSNNVFSGYTVGSYNTYVRDAGGCVYTVPAVTVSSKRNELGITASKIRDEVCDGNGNGEIGYTITSGSGTVSLGADTLDNSNSKFYNVPPGTYKVKLTNVGCSAESGSVTINAASNISATTSTTNVSCQDSDYGPHDDGAITIEASGGWRGFSYRRTVVNTTDNWGNWQTSNTISGLSAGSYVIQVKDQNGCDDFKEQVSVVANPVLSITPIIKENAHCKGDANGIVTANTTGGNSNYTSLRLFNGATDQNIPFINNVFSGIRAGTYKIYVQDGNGCNNYSSEFSVSEPATALDFSTSITHLITCASGQGISTDGEISLSEVENSGWGNYEYSIKKENNIQENWRTDKVFNNLPEGTHTFFIKDGGGCIVSKTQSISGPQKLSIIVYPTHEICAGTNNGQFKLNSIGGKGSRNFSLTHANNTFDLSKVSKIEQAGADTVFKNLAPSNGYIITVSDNNCSTSLNAQEIKPYTNPSILSENIAMYPVDCYGNSTGSLVVTSIARGYNFLNAPFDLDSLFFYDSNRVKIREQKASEPSFSNLSAGSYSIKVKDINGCNSAEGVGKVVSQPDSALHFNKMIINDSVDCKGDFDGRLDFLVGGGTNLYHSDVLYKANVGSNSFTPIDIDDINRNYFDKLGVGRYFIYAEDKNLCEAYSDTLYISEPEKPLKIDYLVLNPITCNVSDSGEHNDGRVKITASGGWDLSYYYDIKRFKADADEWNHTKDVYNGLNHDTLIIQVKDSGDCIVSNKIVIPQADALQIIDSVLHHEICDATNNGEIEISASKSHPNYSIILYDGITPIDSFQNITENSGVTFPNRYPSDNYYIKIRDSKGCSQKTNYIPILPYKNPELFLNNIIMDSVRCYGDNSGKLTLQKMSPGQNIGGQTFPYDSIFIKGQIAENYINRKYEVADTVNILFDNLFRDTYDIYVKDINNCYSDTIRPEEKEPSLLEIMQDSLKHVSCYGFDDGILGYQISGGNGGYSVPVLYQTLDTLNNIPVDELFANLPKGNYSFRVNDYKNCPAESDLLFVDGPDYPITLNIDTTLVDCDSSDLSGEMNNGRIIITNIHGGYDPGNGYLFPYRFALKESGDAVFSDYQYDSLFIGEPVGHYTIRVRDTLCADYYAFTTEITSQPKLTIHGTPFDEVCQDMNNGKIIFASKGGYGNHRYHLFRDTMAIDSLAPLLPEVNYHFSDLIPNDYYTILVTDSLGCTRKTPAGSLPIFAYTNPKILSDSVKFDSAHCYGEANGTVEIRGIKGWHYNNYIPFTKIHVFNDSDKEVYTDPFDGLFRRNDFAFGEYYFILEDDSTCTSNKYKVRIDQPDSLLIHLLDLQNVIGKGEASGTITIGISGGNSGFQTITAFHDNSSIFQTTQITKNWPRYEWKGFVADTFSIKVNDYHNCSNKINNVVIREPDSLLSFKVISKNDALCKASVGNFTIKGLGGWGGYKFIGATRNSFHESIHFNDLYAGNYEVTVKDSMGATFTNRVVINEPKDSLLVYLSDIKHPTCGDNGVIVYQIQGGTPHYRLTYVPGDTFNIWSPYQFIAPDLADGNYLATVFDSNLCRFDIESTLSGIQRLQILDLTIERFATTDTSPGNGSIRAIVSGGINNHFQLCSAHDTILSATGDTNIFTGLLPGLYDFKAISESGCEQSKAIYLPHFYDYPMDVLETRNESGFNLSDGSASFLVPFSNPESIILKRDSDHEFTYNIGSVNTTYSPADSILKVEMLAPGSYIAIVTNSNQRVAFAEFKIKPYELFQITKEKVADVIRHNDANGSIHVDCKGGAGENIYNWICNSDPGRGLNPENSPDGTHLNNIPAGTYSLTITDQNGYSLNGKYILENPPQLEMAYQKLNVHCKDSADGFVGLKTKGGWGSYQYKVDTANNFANSPQIFDLVSRPYWFYVVDKRGARDSIFVNISEPDYLRSLVSYVDSVDCYNGNNGLIRFKVNGGTLPYRFKQLHNSYWTKDTIDDKLSEGFYTYQFTDSNSCSGIDTLLVYMPQPDTLLLSDIDIKHTTCGLDNGRISVNPVGGTKPYSYQWSDNKGRVIGNQNSVDSLHQSGQYYLSVFDYHGCVTKFDQQINSSSLPHIDSLKVTPVLCFGDSTGSARVLSLTEGIPYAPYSIQWSDGDIGNETHRFNEGDHWVSIIDTNNCLSKSWFNITQPDKLETLVIDSAHVSCFGYNNGFIRLKTIGGTGQHKILWNTGDTLNFIDSLFQGNYTLLLLDSNNCTYTKTYTINQPPSLNSLVTTIGQPLCKGGTDGKINFDITGGTPPYRVKKLTENLWRETTTISGLGEGVYNYHFTDANNCISPDTLTIPIIAPDSLLFENIDITNTTCNTDNGKIKVSMKGGVEPYSYKWTDIKGHLLDTTNHVENLKQLAQYKIEVADAHNCINYEVKQIQSSTLPRVSDIKTWPVLCWGDTTGRARVVKVDTAFPSAPVSFTWSNNESGVESDRFFEGEHYVIITDTNGCSSKRFFSITSPKPLLGHLMDYAEPSCFGYEDGCQEIYPKGGVGCYSIKWSNNDTHLKADSLIAGSYDYVLRDSNGCEFDETAELAQPGLLQSKVTAIDSIFAPATGPAR